MTNMDFRIIKYEFDNKSYYELMIDGKTQLDKVPLQGLRVIINEIEKFCRLRFKGELKHKKVK